MNNFTLKQRNQIRNRYRNRIELNTRARRKATFGVVSLFILSFIIYPLLCVLLGD